MPGVPPVRRDAIRNFSIIAHIDHGKSTLADRLLERTGTVAPRDMQAQVLDTLDLERERGITIKAQAVRMEYTARDGRAYELNLIDTPGHVDFAYEVSRALAACEGAILVVDATQGVEAQTLANVDLALEHDHELIPVINKIDLPAADPELVRREIQEVVGLPGSGAILASARDGTGVDEILEAVVARVPPPRGDPEAPLTALIFDAKYDAYRGVVVYVRVFDGSISPGERIRMMATEKEFVVDEVGVFRPVMTPTGGLGAGEVGYLIASIKNVRDSKVGDTVTLADRPAAAALPGYRSVTPMVYAGIFPIDSDDVQELKEALEKLNLNDASLVWEPESSAALGFGFRCGFLGLLHMEIVQERLEREFDLSPDHHRPDRRVPDPAAHRRGGPGRQPGAAARPLGDRGDRGAALHGHHPGAHRPRRGDHGALPGAARRVPQPGAPDRRSGGAGLRPPPGRDHPRLL